MDPPGLLATQFDSSSIQEKMFKKNIVFLAPCIHSNHSHFR